MFILANIRITHRGSFKRTDKFLKKMSTGEIFEALSFWGSVGVNALAEYTPVDTGYTASAWGYEIVKNKKVYGITWTNTNIIPGYAPLVIMLQYGHGTGTGGYVQGRDFINPAIRPIFDTIADVVWKEVQNA